MSGSFRPKLPPWIRVKVESGETREQVDNILQSLKLNTVCRGAQCPNLNECWHRGTATFMIMGSKCTRNCKFCAVPHAETKLPPPDPDEAGRIVEAVKRMELKYVVITSVTRDDLADGGAGEFAKLIKLLHRELPEVGVEVLTPDFNDRDQDIRTVIEARPTVFNHNVETVRRLARKIRSVASYERSLSVLRKAFEFGKDANIPIKSGLMVGLGETDEEVLETIDDLRACGVSILTIGQYLPPGPDHWKLERYVTPEKFAEFAEYASSAGFKFVASSPLVRSSYNAAEAMTAKGE